MSSEYIKLIVWVVVVAAAFFYLWHKGHLVALSQYVAETREELRKCTWPSIDELKGSTVVVMIDPKGAATNTVSALPAGLVLKGLAGPPRRRLAIINNHTVAAGETAEIKVDGRLLKVRCLEVRERSVLLRFDDQAPQELFLRKNF